MRRMLRVVMCDHLRRRRKPSIRIMNTSIALAIVAAAAAAAAAASISKDVTHGVSRLQHFSYTPDFDTFRHYFPRIYATGSQIKCGVAPLRLVVSRERAAWPDRGGGISPVSIR